MSEETYADQEPEQPEKDNPLFQLDVVLIFLYHRVGKIFTPKQITTGVLNDINVNEVDVILMVKKLKKDNYVDEYDIPNPNDNRVIPDRVDGYSINFNGKLFLKQGGYNLTAIREADENARLGRIESDQMAIQTSIGRLTFWIAVGAVISAAYYLYYLIIPIYDHLFLEK